jgi:hypothetical protein
MAGTDRRFLFQNRILPVLYMCPSRVQGYHEYGYGYGGTRAQVQVRGSFAVFVLQIYFLFCNVVKSE